MNSWIQALKENIATEFGEKPAVATLATVRDNGSADARCVVVRKLLDDGQMLITSDARSEKNQQLKLNPSATIVFWLATQRKQFRIDGTISVLTGDDPQRLLAWQSSSDSARALFYWPPAGEPRQKVNDQTFPAKIGKDQPMPDTFEVLILSPQSADVLDLKPHPHLRIRWSFASKQWTESVINP